LLNTRQGSMRRAASLDDLDERKTYFVAEEHIV